MFNIAEAILKYRSICEQSSTCCDVDGQLERFRSDLAGQPRVEQISTYLWLYGSHQRVEPLIAALAEEPHDVFWRVFIEMISICDGIWPFRAIVRDMALARARLQSPIEFMEAEDREFFDQLPERVRVFRGCARRGVRSLCWTLDEDVALGFAHGKRFPAPPDPVVAAAEVSKQSVLFAKANDEAEVFLDPYAITALRLHAAPRRTSG